MRESALRRSPLGGPCPVPGLLEAEENLPLPAALSSLALHFDA
jgi:hypothetical protein